jgi:hypothetical protein
MGTVSRLQARDGAGRTAPGRTPRPGRIAVHIDAGHDVVHVHVAGARMPARIYLYVDGDLADMWVDVEGSYRLAAAGLPPGPHAITARAVDTLGRWGGASTVIETGST